MVHLSPCLLAVLFESRSLCTGVPLRPLDGDPRNEGYSTIGQLM